MARTFVSQCLSSLMDKQPQHAHRYHSLQCSLPLHVHDITTKPVCITTHFHLFAHIVQMSLIETTMMQLCRGIHHANDLTKISSIRPFTSETAWQFSQYFAIKLSITKSRHKCIIFNRLICPNENSIHRASTIGQGIII